MPRRLFFERVVGAAANLISSGLFNKGSIAGSRAYKQRAWDNASRDHPTQLGPLNAALITPQRQFGSLKEPILVCQLNAPVALWYSVEYQKVQSSFGSTVIVL